MQRDPPGSGVPNRKHMSIVSQTKRGKHKRNKTVFSLRHASSQNGRLPFRNVIYPFFSITYDSTTLFLNIKWASAVLRGRGGIPKSYWTASSTTVALIIILFVRMNKLNGGPQPGRTKERERKNRTCDTRLRLITETPGM